MLHIKQLRFSFGANEVLKGVDLDILPGEVVALLGANGSGKTTLLNIIRGVLKPDSGAVILENTVRFAFLPQETPPFEGTAMEFLLESFPEIGRIYRTMTSLPIDSPDYAEAINEFHKLGGFELEAKINARLYKYGFVEEDLKRPYSSFSKGQQRLWAIFRVFLRGANLLLLDEPTNHLDLQMCQKLERVILEYKSKKCSVLLVSHDRLLIDRVADRSYYLKTGTAVSVNGGYSLMLSHLKSDFESRLREAKEIERKIKQLEFEVSRRISWASSKEAKKKFADKVMNKGHIGRKAAKLAKRAKAVQKRTQAMIRELKEKKPFVEKPIEIELPQYEVSSRKVISATGLSFAFGTKTLFRDVNLELYTKDRVGLIGPNGCGKTTLMRCLVGELKPQGELYRNDNVRWKYIPQDVRAFFRTGSLIDNLRVPELDELQLRQALGAAGFRRDKVFQDVGSLSYGELMRAAILKAMLEKIEFLFLDEPTNHLDIESLEILDRLFNAFPGGMFFISHDRHFIATHGDSLYTFEAGNIRLLFEETPVDLTEFSRTIEIISQTSEDVKNEKEK
ncbi:ABC-F family ATP-binding cassette domain-containing protein [Kosmotoga pacifica]|uniref:ABC transporter domain-containing protein n=2 Tax=Kosmotoga pacifica TaxID=1330330 RepID=A0A0G2ZE34_9BACT|nr:ABC-F family ATP-binding cassette domain-containing protein [Kosmotoga pacifica]AKI97819.1 hypothetical protein IX53_08355 [Kosmotoga pacifica]